MHDNETLFLKIKKLIPNGIKAAMKKLIPNFFGNHTHKVGRINTLTNEVNKEIIFSIIPNFIKHCDKNLMSTDIELFNFLDTHLSLANGVNTPRFAILFLEKIFNIAEKYYYENIDLVIKNTGGRFNLFIRITEEETTWKSWLESFYTIKGNKYSFSYNDFCKLLEIKPEEENEFQYFLSFLTHLNILNCNSRSTKYESRRFSLPILFRCNLVSQKDKW
jgi:hypothetical protein